MSRQVQHTCSPMYIPPPLRGPEVDGTLLQPGPEVGDQDVVTFEEVEPQHLQHYNFVYLPCGHWFFFRSLRKFYKSDPRCPFCKRSFFPKEVKWVPPNNPVAVSGYRRERWIRSRLGPFFSRVRDATWSVACMAHGAHAVVEPTSYQWLDEHDTLQFFYSTRHITLSNGTTLYWGNSTILAVTPHGLLCEIRGVHDLSHWADTEQEKQSFAKGISVLHPLRQWGAIAVRFSLHTDATFRPFVVMTTMFEFLLLLAAGPLDAYETLGLEAIVRAQDTRRIHACATLLIPPDIMEAIKPDEQMQGMGYILEEYSQTA